MSYRQVVQIANGVDPFNLRIKQTIYQSGLAVCTLARIEEQQVTAYDGIIIEAESIENVAQVNFGQTPIVIYSSTRTMAELETHILNAQHFFYIGKQMHDEEINPLNFCNQVAHKVVKHLKPHAGWLARHRHLTPQQQDTVAFFVGR
jgi:hypothetical protein